MIDFQKVETFLGTAIIGSWQLKRARLSAFLFKFALTGAMQAESMLAFPFDLISPSPTRHLLI